MTLLENSQNLYDWFLIRHLKIYPKAWQDLESIEPHQIQALLQIEAQVSLPTLLRRIQLESQRKFVIESNPIDFLNAIEPDMIRTIQNSWDTSIMGNEPDWNEFWKKESDIKKQLKLEQINKELRQL